MADTVTTCEINILNMSNRPKRFLLFQEVPVPTNRPVGEVFTNVYQRSPKIQSGQYSHTVFEMDSQFYAVYGTSSENAEGDVRVRTSNAEIVKLGPNGSVCVVSKKEGYLMWDDTAVKGRQTKAQGGFSLITDHSFSAPNEDNIYIGVGAKDPNDDSNIIPIATYLAEPGLNSQLFPHLTYYICTGEYEPGTIVDRNTLGDVLRVDFTGASVTKAVFTVDDKDNYTDPSGKNVKNGITWAVTNAGDNTT